MMENELLAQLNLWHRDDEHTQIIYTIMAIPASDWDYNLSCLLARAHNNNEEYDKAIKILKSVQEQGIDDALWHFRMGYAYFYKNMESQAATFFVRSAELGDDIAKEFLVYCEKALKYGNQPPTRG